mgnify:CR=1 FL=1
MILKTPKIKNLLIDSYEHIAKEYKVVGSSMAVIKNRHLTFEHHTGYGDKAIKRKTDIDTIYNWASITKTLTGVAVMQLRDLKKLKLTDPIVKYVPELKKMKNPFGKMEDITIWHILTHSSGFRCDTWPIESSTGEGWKDLMATMDGFEILFKPGSRTSYSNLAVNFLGQAIKRITGMSYEKYVKKNILQPLGMNHSYFDLTPRGLSKHRSNNYYIKNGKVVANGFDFKTGVTTPNCGLNAPCSDMVKYLAFLCNGGSILKRSSLKEMWKMQLPMEKDRDMAADIGLSFFLIKHKGSLFIGHTGSSFGYICFLYINPKSKSGCVVNFNTAGKNKKPDTRKGLYEIRKELFKQMLR